MGTVAAISGVYALGFFLPGYFVSRLLRCRQTAAASFIFSVLLLFQAVFWFQVCSIPVWLPHLIAAMLAITAVAGLASLLRKQPRISLRCRATGWQPVDRIVAGLAGVIFLFFCHRVCLAPLLGPDTIFRWDFLAHRILEYGHLDYYPPLSPEDFAVYFYTDGIPPLVSCCYFWLYAPLTDPTPSVTGLVVGAQMGATLLLVYQACQKLYGAPAGVVGVAILLSSRLFLWGVAIGQETGFTALAAAGVLYYIVDADDLDAIQTMAPAGAAAALGALSREYGWIFLICGLVIARRRQLNWRWLALFSATTLVLAAPWYIRSWILTGNPFYSNAVGDLFTINSVHTEILATYAVEMGFQGQFIDRAGTLLGHVLHNACIPVIGGITAVFVCRRTRGHLAACVVLTTAVWLYSVKFTAGEYLSTRVLTAALVFLSVAAAGLVTATMQRNRNWRRALTLLLLAACAWSGSYMFVYPRDPADVPLPDWPAAATARLQATTPEVALNDEFESGKIPPGSSFRILTGSPYAHAVLYDKPVAVVPVWSPEVAVIFNRDLPPTDIRAALRSMGITAVLYFPYSLNSIYLNTHSFYGVDRENWIPLADHGDFILYGLPLPPELHATPVQRTGK